MRKLFLIFSLLLFDLGVSKAIDTTPCRELREGEALIEVIGTKTVIDKSTTVSFTEFEKIIDSEVLVYRGNPAFLSEVIDKMVSNSGFSLNPNLTSFSIDAATGLFRANVVLTSWREGSVLYFELSKSEGSCESEVRDFAGL